MKDRSHPPGKNGESIGGRWSCQNKPGPVIIGSALPATAPAPWKVILFRIQPGTRWKQCFGVIAFDFLETRAKLARTGKGWKDCGSDLQELSSHVVTVDSLCDLLEKCPGLTDAGQKSRLLAQVACGMEYIVLLQERARELGLGDGPVVHESRQSDLTTGNTVMAAMIFARASRLLRDSHPDLSEDFKARAVRAYGWIKQNGPIIPEEDPVFFAPVHGAPDGAKPPAGQWMTRDLLMMARAALELHKAGLPGYQVDAVGHARAVMRRQISEADAEGGLFGHFWLYDDFSSFGGVRFSEKAVIHCGAWSKEGRIYNKGGHYPHHLIPLIEMLAMWPRARRCPGMEKMSARFRLRVFFTGVPDQSVFDPAKRVLSWCGFTALWIVVSRPEQHVSAGRHPGA